MKRGIMNLYIKVMNFIIFNHNSILRRLVQVVFAITFLGSIFYIMSGGIALLGVLGGAGSMMVVVAVTKEKGDY